MSMIPHISAALNSNSYRKEATKTSIAIAIEEEAHIIDSVKDLIDPDYAGWFVKRLRLLGRHKFLEAAEKARKYGRDPRKLFGHLVR